MQATVDWMNFWLQDRENPALDGGRLERWRAMKADWRKDQMTQTMEGSGGN
jgi:hypothetical protein